MTQNLSPQIARVLALGKAEARRTHQEKVGAVTLLLGMLNDREGAALKVIEQFGISTEQLRNTLEAQIEPSSNEAPPQEDTRWREMSIAFCDWHNLKRVCSEKIMPRTYICSWPC